MGNIEKFNYIANQYDTPERVAIAKIIADTIRAYVQNGKEKDAIDYGCGTGLIGIQLLNDFQSMLFIDASSNMIEQVKQKIDQLNINNATMLCCDFETQSSTDLRADYVIVVQTLLHIKEIEPVLSQLYHVLNKGGHLLIVDFDKNDSVVSDDVHNGFEQGFLINTMKKLGFTNVNAETFYHGNKLFMNRDASLFIMDAMK